MTTSARTRVVVTDASVLINPIHVDRLELLGALHGWDFVVPPEVEAEVGVAAQSAALARALEVGHVSRLSFSGTAELQLFAEVTAVLGKGEAACLAMAAVHGWHMASDERRRFLRLAEERLGPGRVVNTAGLFVLAIRAGLISVEEADADKRVLEAHRFKMRFSSFRDVIGTSNKE